MSFGHDVVSMICIWVEVIATNISCNERHKQVSLRRQENARLRAENCALEKDVIDLARHPHVARCGGFGADVFGP